MPQFKASVAWYGFSDAGGSVTQPKAPAEFIGQLERPMLILHGSEDVPSPVDSIYDYVKKLDAAGKNFKLVVYQGAPQGFLLKDSKIDDSYAILNK